MFNKNKKIEEELRKLREENECLRKELGESIRLNADKDWAIAVRDTQITYMTTEVGAYLIRNYGVDNKKATEAVHEIHKRGLDIREMLERDYYRYY